jgi:hypothetical protein
LPDSSSGVREAASLAPGLTPVSAGVEPATTAAKAELKDCPYDETRARECRMHWKSLLIESTVFNAFQNAGNLSIGYWYRWETMHGKWWDRYIAFADQWKWDRWSDDNPILEDYVGHPMIGRDHQQHLDSEQPQRHDAGVRQQ